MPQRDEPENLAREQVGAHHLVRARAGRLAEPMHECAPDAVDHAVGHVGRDDLPLEGVAREVHGVTLGERAREVALDRGGDPRVIGQRGGYELVEEPHLAVGEQDGVFGVRETLPLRAPFRDLVVRRQELERAIEPPRFLEELHEAPLRVEQLRRDAARHRQHLRLEVVVAQHQPGDIVGHFREQSIALLFGKLALGDRHGEQDLGVNLVIGRVDAGRVVNGVGIDAAACERVFDPAELGTAEVAALDKDLAPQFAPVHTQRIVGTVADLRVRLARGLHVRADPAVVDEIHRRLEDCVDELRWRQRVGGDRERRYCFRRDGDDLGASRVNTAAGGDQRRVVVTPRRARQPKQPLAFGEAPLWVGVWIEKDVPVIERRNELRVPGEQHAVAEHVARHVADARYGEIGRLRVDPHFAEVPLHRFPCPARGDAHRLVVVTHRAAGRERISQPEAILPADGIGVIGERRRSLVCGDHEIRVVGVVPRHLRRSDDRIADAIVGEVQEPTKIVLIAGHSLLHVAVPVDRRRRRALQHEATLGADRHDHGVFDHLRLDEPQDLGAEVLGAVRPAQPAAGHLAPAQVHSLEPGGVHKDLEHRLGFGKAGHLRRIELEREEATPASRRVAPPVVGARRRQDERQVLTQHAVLGKILDARRARVDLLRSSRAPASAPAAVDSGSKRTLKSSIRNRGDVRVRGERCLDERLRKRESDLAHVFRIRAKHDDIRGRKPRGNHQAVEVVVLDLAAEDAAERILEHLMQRVDLDVGIGDRCLHAEVVHPDRAARPSARSGAGARRAPSCPCARASAGCRTARPARRRWKSLKRSTPGAASSGR